MFCFPCIADLACCKAYSGHWVTHSWYDQVSVYSLTLYVFVSLVSEYLQRNLELGRV